jgi:GT2 family glycosyltransferase
MHINTVYAVYKKNSILSMGSISVIIPTLNRHDDLRKCLRSIAENTRQPDEVIIVEQGNIEATKRVVSEFSLNTQINYLAEKSASKARNLGVEKSSGHILIFLDDDVELVTNYIDTAERYLSEVKNYSVLGISGKDLVQAASVHTPADYLRQLVGVIFWRSTFGYKNRVLASGHNVLRNTHDTECEAEWCLGATMCFRREAFDDGHKFEERFIRWSFGEDVMFTYKLHLKRPGSIMYIPSLKFFHNTSSVGRMQNVQLTKVMIVYRYIFWRECVKQAKWWRILPYLWSQVGFVIIEMISFPSMVKLKTIISTYIYLVENHKDITNATVDVNKFIIDKRKHSGKD